MDPFSQDVLSQPAGSRVEPETLEMLGRKASQMFQQTGTPLNDAIRELVSQHPELGNEHVKRVVEFANTVTFQQMFQNGGDKNVHFEVADPGVIMRDLKDGGSPAFSGQTMHEDYKTSPKQSGTPGSESGLDQYLWPQGVDDGAGGSLKAASANLGGTLDELHDTRLQLQGAIEKLSESYEVAGEDLDSAKERLYGAIKQEVVGQEGSGLGGVVGALTKVASEDMVATILPGMVGRLREEGYQPQMLEASLEKRAGAFINPEHPLVSSFQEIIKLATQMATIDGAITEANTELQAVKAEIQKVAGPLTSGVRDAINAPGKVSPALRQRFPRT